MAARSIGSGTISFGLVTIPFKLFTAVSPESVSFHMLHAKCGCRVKQQLLCPAENVVVERHDTVKGYETGRDSYVQFTADELKALEAARTNVITLAEFVPSETLDLLHIEKTYFLGPDGPAGARSYALLATSLREKGVLAVGRHATRGKDNLVVIAPYRRGLALHQCYYATEVRSFDEIELGDPIEFREQERALAGALIDQLRQPAFDASRFRDEWVAAVKAVVDKKIAGEQVTIAAPAPKANIVDLLEALQRSVAELDAAKAANDSSGGAPKGEPKKAAPRKASRRRASSTEAG